MFLRLQAVLMDEKKKKSPVFIPSHFVSSVQKFLRWNKLQVSHCCVHKYSYLCRWDWNKYSSVLSDIRIKMEIWKIQENCSKKMFDKKKKILFYISPIVLFGGKKKKKKRYFALYEIRQIKKTHIGFPRTANKQTKAARKWEEDVEFVSSESWNRNSQIGHYMAANLVWEQLSYVFTFVYIYSATLVKILFLLLENIHLLWSEVFGLCSGISSILSIFLLY